MIHPIFALIGLETGSFLISRMAAAVGVLVLMRSSTARRAQQIMSLLLIVLLLSILQSSRLGKVCPVGAPPQLTLGRRRPR